MVQLTAECAESFLFIYSYIYQNQIKVRISFLLTDDYCWRCLHKLSICWDDGFKVHYWPKKQQ